MFTSPFMAVIFAVVMIAIGSVIGLVVTALVCRSQLTPRVAFLGAVIGGVGCLLASLLSGWAGSHAYFENGVRKDMTPWGEDLRLRNWLAQHELLICGLSSSLGGLVAGLMGCRTASTTGKSPESK